MKPKDMGICKMQPLDGTWREGFHLWFLQAPYCTVARSCLSYSSFLVLILVRKLS